MYFILDAYLDIDICITVSKSLIRELQVHQFSFFFVLSYFNFSAGNILKVSVLGVAALLGDCMNFWYYVVADTLLADLFGGIGHFTYTHYLQLK